MNSFAGLFYTSIPTVAEISVKLTPNFMMDGMDATDDKKELTTASSPVSAGDYFVVSSTDVVDNFNQNNVVGTTEWADITQYNAASAVVSERRVKFVNVDGDWLISGNERAVLVS